jgi:hypothetical protein
MSSDSRLKILEMLEKGTITAEQAIELLQSSADLPEAEKAPAVEKPAPPVAELTADAQAIASSQEMETLPPPIEEPKVSSASSSAAAAEVTPQPFRNPAQAWRRWWWYPLWAGVGITLVGALLMYLAYDRSGFGFWFACTWFPFLLGVMVMALAWASRQARWLHVRIHQPEGEVPRNIAISFPLPLRLAAWIVRTFHVHIPHMERTSLDELIIALERTNPDAPFYVEVQDDEDGERVEVYIG